MVFSGVGAILLAIAVILGAFGAHGLRGRIDEYSLGVYERAVFYHFIHALGLLVAPLFVRNGMLHKGAAALVCWTMLIGIVIFSGSLYVLAISGARWMGAVTPIGGLFLIGAWVELAVGLLRRYPRKTGND